MTDLPTIRKVLYRDVQAGDWFRNSRGWHFIQSMHGTPIRLCDGRDTGCDLDGKDVVDLVVNPVDPESEA